MYIDYLEFKGKKYKKVNRKARTGDLVIFTNNQSQITKYVTQNKPYEVFDLEEWNRVGFKNDAYEYHPYNCNIFSVYSFMFERNENTVIVYELEENYHLMGKNKNKKEWFTIEYGTYDECIEELKRITEYNKDSMFYKLVKVGDLDLSKHAGTLFE